MTNIVTVHCPKCGSEDWRLASIVYSEGLTHTSSTGIGGAVLFPHTGDGVPGVGITSTNGISQSSLSQLAAPPEKGEPSVIIKSEKYFRSLRLGFTFVGVTVLSAILFSKVNINENPILMFIAVPLPAFLGLIFLIRFVVQYFDPEVRKRNHEIKKKHDDEYQTSLLRYQQTKMCLRCGIFFDDQGIIGSRASPNG